MEDNNTPQELQTPDIEPSKVETDVLNESAIQTPQDDLQFNNQDRPVIEENLNKPKKKRFILLLVAALVLLLLTTGTITAYAFRDNLSNTIAKMTKSPAEYYAFVEKKAISSAIGQYAPYVKNASKNTAYKANTEVTFDRDSIDSLTKSSMNVSLSDLESQLGLKFENLGFNVLYGKKDNILNETFGFSFNKTNLITLECLMDTTSNKTLLRFPELSKAYLNLIDEKQDVNKVKLPTPAETVDFLDRYSNLIVNNISQVEEQDNSVYKLDTLSTQCTKLTVTITNEEAKKIILAIYDQAKNDEYIINLLPLYDISKEEYQSSIDTAKADLKSSTEKLLEKNLNMTVYVDNTGNIICRQFVSQDSNLGFGYGLITKSSDTEYNLYANNEDGNTVFNVTGHHKKVNGVYNGSATLKVSVPNESDFEDVSIDLKYEDVKTETKNNHSFQYGTYYLSSADLMGLQITSAFSVKDDIQSNKTTFKLGTTKLATLDTTVESINDYKPSMPAKDAETYNMSDIEKYYSTIDINAYISSLSEKLGIDIESLLNNSMLGLNGSSEGYSDDYSDDYSDEDSTY